LRAKATGGFVQCDTSGNLYVPLLEQSPDHPATFVRRISPEGEPGAAFSTDPVPGGMLFDAIGVGGKGEVVLMPKWSSGAHLLSLSAAGRLLSHGRFDDRAVAFKLAPFPDGNVLVTYRIKLHAHTGIYNRLGRLLHTVEIPDDALIESRLGSAELINDAVDLGKVTAAEDGTVYLMRYGNPALVYQINSQGTIMRRYEIHSPLGTLFPWILQVRDGKLIFMDREDWNPHVSMVMLVDATSGETLRTYDISGLGADKGCFDPQKERMTFVRTAYESVSVGHAGLASAAGISVPRP
jgi:hypothetical protein